MCAAWKCGNRSDRDGVTPGRRVTADSAPALSGALLASFRRAIACVEAVDVEIGAAAARLADRWERGGRLHLSGRGRLRPHCGGRRRRTARHLRSRSRRIAVILCRRRRRAVRPRRSRGRRWDAGGTGASRRSGISGATSSSPSRRAVSTPFTLAGREARPGAPARSSSPSPTGRPLPLLTAADFPLLLDSGDEALQGSTRLAAGVAQKCALGMLSTLVGLALGHIHAGLMVNLRADNDKLHRRALAIVMSISGVDENKARPRWRRPAAR